MMHGVSSIVQASQGGPAKIALSGVIGLVGTAPMADVDAGNRTLNTPVVCSNDRDDAKFFGPDTAGYTIPAALKAIRAQHRDGAGARVVVVNRFDLATHLDEDDEPDPAEVLATDVIGTTSGAGVRSGMQALRDVQGLYGYRPTILIVPGFCATPTVSAAMDTLAGLLKGVAIVDAPLATTVAGAIAGRGVGGTIGFNTSSNRRILTYPHVKALGPDGEPTNQPMSQFLAGLMAVRDQSHGYWHSPSNAEFQGVVGMERPLTADLMDANSEVHQLNEAGIVTLFRAFGTGIKAWGNYTAGYPTETAAINFIANRRTADVIEVSIAEAMLAHLDAPGLPLFIDAVTQTVDGVLRRMKQLGAILDGRVWFDPADNTTDDLELGKYTWSYDFHGPTPMQHIALKVSYNRAYLQTIFGGAN